MLLVAPLLNALGWDISDRSMVIPDYRVGKGRVDYALLGSGQGARGRRPVAFIDVRPLGAEIVDADRSKALILANLAGANYVGLTNGDRWEFHDVFNQSFIAGQRILAISIRYQDASTCARALRDAALRLAEQTASPTMGHTGFRVRTYYDELNVDPSAPLAEIRRAYLQKIKEVHPDVSRRSQANRESARLNQIYEILSNQQLRRDYDAITFARDPGSVGRRSQRSRSHAGRRQTQSNRSSQGTGPVESEEDQSQSDKSSRGSTRSQEGQPRQDRNRQSRSDKRRTRSNRPSHGTGPPRSARTSSQSKRGPTQSASKSTRARSRSPYWRTRRRAGFWRKARWLAVRLIVLAVLFTSALIGYHAYSGAPIGPAIDMMTEDYRVAVACPTDPGRVLDFVGRAPYPDERSNMSSRFLSGWEVQMCDGVLAYEQPAEDGESGQTIQTVTTLTKEPVPDTPVSRSTPIPASGGEQSVLPSAKNPTSTATQIVEERAGASSSHKYPGGSPLNRREVEKWVVEFTNEKRTNSGLQPLRDDDAISDIARAHSEDMARLGLLSHDIGGNDPTERAMAAGYNCRAHIGGGWYSFGLSENIYEYPRVIQWRGLGRSYRPTDYIRDAEAMARELVAGWMNSPGHRDNILDKDSRRIGVGIAIRETPEYGYSHETVYATQNFSACR